jgi:hypothetical protein
MLLQECGCALLHCPAIGYSFMHIAPVLESNSKLSTPQQMAMYLELLNMEVDDLLSLATNNKTG